jgi:predicted nucleic acid-binding protein
MTTYLVDTNILIDAFRGKRGRRQLLSRVVSEGNSLACCDVTVAEIYSGMQPHEAVMTDAFLSALVWYNTNRTIARRAGRFRFEYARQGLTLSLPDTLIAATALEHGLTLMTANRKDFPMTDLPLYAPEEKL